jgi:hypothetical protein
MNYLYMYLFSSRNKKIIIITTGFLELYCPDTI